MSLRLMPIVYVSDMDRSIAFYRSLGLKLEVQSRSAQWAELKCGDALLALHRGEKPQQRPYRWAAGHASTTGWGEQVRQQPVKLCFLSNAPLHNLIGELRTAGVEIVREVTDEGFGYSMQVRDPDGLTIQIDEHDSELYT